MNIDIEKELHNLTEDLKSKNGYAFKNLTSLFGKNHNCTCRWFHWQKETNCQIHGES